MKKILLILSIVLFAVSVNAQKQNKPFTANPVDGDTSTYASNVPVITYANTMVGFLFTKADVADSLAIAKMQGSMDNSEFVDLTDATANLTETTTDGTTFLYVTNPIYLYYRAWLSAAAGDTVTISNERFIIKED